MLTAKALRRLDMNLPKQPPLLPAMQLAFRAALAAGLAVALAELLGLQHPLYALIGAVIVSDLSPARTRQLGVKRLVGSALGAIVGATVSQFLPAVPWAIGVSVLAAMGLSYLLRLHSAAKISGYVCGIVMLGHGGEAWSYAFYRLVETLLGIGLATLVSFVPKLIPGDPPKPAA
jgi:uncharacterized membrane protein YgaE (UPF0421/DUF939 family)